MLAKTLLWFIISGLLGGAGAAEREREIYTRVLFSVCGVFQGYLEELVRLRERERYILGYYSVCVVYFRAIWRSWCG